MEIFGIARQGLQDAGARVDRAAQKIAQPDGDSSPADDVVSLLTSKVQFEADLKLVQTADDMQKKTLDLLA